MIEFIQNIHPIYKIYFLAGISMIIIVKMRDIWKNT